MKKTLFTIAFLGIIFEAFAQNNLSFVVTDATSHEPLIGATIVSKTTANVGTATDAEGKATLGNLPNGAQQIEVSFVGYADFVQTFVLPQTDNSPIMIALAANDDELEVVTVTSTRTDTRIEDLSTKVEILGLTELTEENGAKPGSIVSLLGDIAGVQVQQQSASSGNTAIRIQGLNGRYVQTLQDGLPAFNGFSGGGLGLLQIRPLNLQQVEIIKGASSTLFGGDAIGGIINLVSKKPTNEPEVALVFNQTSLGESNINGFAAAKKGNLGVSIFAGHTTQPAADIDKDGLSDVPMVQSTFLQPKIFYTVSPKTNLTVGLTSASDVRTGGDIQLLNGGANAQHTYFVTQNSRRITGDAILTSQLTPTNTLTVKALLGNTDRTIKNNQYSFSANQVLYYTEANYLLKSKKTDWVFGLNVNGDIFTKNQYDTAKIANYRYQTVGAFAQNSWRVTSLLTLETGLRADLHNKYGAFLLPRVSALFHIHKDLTARINGGTGYKIPVATNYLQEETDLLAYRNTALQPEQATGVNADINYSKRWANGLKLTLNQSFFYTALTHPIFAQSNVLYGSLTLQNATKPVTTQGAQTYLQARYQGIELYLSYNYTDTRKTYDPIESQFLATPRHIVSAILFYEVAEKWRMGIESANVGAQLIGNGKYSQPYWLAAAMIDYKINKHFTLTLNAENLLDVRQSKYSPVYTGSLTRPVFETLYMPIDGRVVNLALQVRL